MRYLDLREYLGELSRRGLLQIVDERICKDTELVPLVRLQFRGLPDAQRKAFWFRNVTDARGREFDGSVVLGRARQLACDLCRGAVNGARSHRRSLGTRTRQSSEAARR